MKQHPEILLQGVGAIGGVIATKLVAAGHSLTLVTGNDAIAAAIRSNGLELLQDGHTTRVTAPVFARLGELPESAQFDLSLLVMKAHAAEQVACETMPYLAADGFLLPLQNGLIGLDVARGIGAAQAICGVVTFGATMLDPGRYDGTVPGTVVIGELDNQLSARLAAAAAILESVASVVTTANLTGTLWAKLVGVPPKR